MRQQSVRFCVGHAGARASVWKLWAHRAEAYLVPSIGGPSLKISFHSSGQCHIKLPWEHATYRDPTITSPIFDLWRGYPLTSGAADLVLQVLTPVVELRHAPLSNRRANAITWLTPPSGCAAVLVSLVVAPQGLLPQWLVGAPESVVKIADLNLSDGGALVAVWSPVTDGVDQLLHVLEDRRQRLTPDGTRFRSGSLDHADPGTRILLPVTAPDGSHLLIDGAHYPHAA